MPENADNKKKKPREKELIDLTAPPSPPDAELAKPITPLVQPSFYMMVQSAASNRLAHTMTRRTGDIDLNGSYKFDTKDFKLFVRDYSTLTGGINTSASKLLDSLLITATRSGLQDTLVSLPLKEYMHMRGLKDVKETRKQVKRDMEALERIRFDYIGRGKNRDFFSIHIGGGTSGIKNSIIFFRFNEDFYQSLRVSDTRFLFMFFPQEALRMNDNANPYSYAFARRISEHKRMNIGRPNADTIRVKTLVDACATFPSYDEVIEHDGAVARRIIEPFERDLDALSDAFAWAYTDTPPQTYQDFISATIHVQWRNYPSTKLLEASRTQRAQKKG